MKPAYLKSQSIHRLLWQLDGSFKVMDDNFNPVWDASATNSKL